MNVGRKLRRSLGPRKVDRTELESPEEPRLTHPRCERDTRSPFGLPPGVTVRRTQTDASVCNPLTRTHPRNCARDPDPLQCRRTTPELAFTHSAAQQDCTYRNGPPFFTNNVPPDHTAVRTRGELYHGAVVLNSARDSGPPSGRMEASRRLRDCERRTTASDVFHSHHTASNTPRHTQCVLPFQLPQCFWRRWRPDHCETDFATRLYIIVTFYRRMCARRCIKRQSDQRDVTPVAFLTQIPNSRAPQSPVAVDFTASNGDISVNNRSTTDREKPIPVDCKFTRHGIASQCFSLRIKSSARRADRETSIPREQKKKEGRINKK